MVNTLGDLERSAMEQLWSAAEPQSVREVHLALTRDRELAYTTVMTVLDRLSKKGMVRREREGRAYLYAAERSRDEMVADVMHTALEGNADDRTAALVAFVSRVSPAEATAMREALAQVEDRQNGAHPR